MSGRSTGNPNPKAVNKRRSKKHDPTDLYVSESLEDQNRKLLSKVEELEDEIAELKKGPSKKHDLTDVYVSESLEDQNRKLLIRVKEFEDEIAELKKG